MTSSTFLVAAALTFAGSVHCVGMCGGFVLATASGGRASRGGPRRVADQLLLLVGKAATYAFLGALAGAFGERVLKSRVLGAGGHALAVAAGLAVAAAGLALLGLGRRAADGPAVRWAAAVWRSLLGPLTTSRPPGFPLVVGMAMGLLPCPLVYAGLAGAAASGGAATGAAILAGVAIGSMPALALVAAFGTALGTSTRLVLARAAGVLLVVAGLVTASHGLGLHLGPHGSQGTSTHDCAVP